MCVSVGIIEEDKLIAINLRKLVEEKGGRVLFMVHTMIEAIRQLTHVTPELLFTDSSIGTECGRSLVNQLSNRIEYFLVLSDRKESKLMPIPEKAPLGIINFPCYETEVSAAIQLFISRNKKTVHIPSRGYTTNYLIVADKGLKRKIHEDDVLYIEAMGNYVKLYVQVNEFFLRKISIRKLLPQLNPDKFMQIHRSIIVHRDKVERGNFQCVYVGKMRFTVGRSYAKEVKKSFALTK